MLLLSMAVEAPHIPLFSSPNREMMYQGNAARYNDHLPEKLLPVYATGITDSFRTPVFKVDSGLTSSIPISRKRSRDLSSLNPQFSIPNAPVVNLNQQQFGSFAFLSEDISLHVYQQQLEIDRFIDQHTEKVRSEIEEMRRRNFRRLMATVQEGMVKKLKTKEDEIVKLGELNWSLEEKLKSLTVENRIWREMAETNEATSNALRNNLQQVLTQIQVQQQQEQHLDFAENAAKANAIALMNDVESCCGSNYEEDHRQRRTFAEDGGSEKILANDENEYCVTTGSINDSMYGRLKRWCRNCGKEESCVLLLPCRHLCVCSVCVNSISICPICKSSKSASIHVNIT